MKEEEKVKREEDEVNEEEVKVRRRKYEKEEEGGVEQESDEVLIDDSDESGGDDKFENSDSIVAQFAVVTRCKNPKTRAYKLELLKAIVRFEKRDYVAKELIVYAKYCNSSQ
eukprot:TRINITY_DN7451_c0_g1_i10.p1 TRINITY_DN7451_c0_g1~~TRINITY_DN7451_c0_g1_i10.p1  ORF type:complete len:112 (-),score=26.75 TRINITY_DN7451_c0_g1_i10:44-379(-)